MGLTILGRLTFVGQGTVFGICEEARMAHQWTWVHFAIQEPGMPTEFRQLVQSSLTSHWHEVGEHRGF